MSLVFWRTRYQNEVFMLKTRKNISPWESVSPWQICFLVLSINSLILINFQENKTSYLASFCISCKCIWIKNVLDIFTGKQDKQLSSNFFVVIVCKRAAWHFSEYLLLRSTEERRLYAFGTTWRTINTVQTHLIHFVCKNRMFQVCHI